MAERVIKLGKSVWHIDEAAPLGSPGGFGSVFQGRGSDEKLVAVKRLHIAAVNAAHRELQISVELDQPFRHVMRVLDAGQDADSDHYYVVMPRAEGNLQDYIGSKGPITETEAVSILLQIAEGLGEVPQIVHRDLKPANILWHEGTWRIADFGIARFVEESTSLQTLKGCLSPAYAAPEQWRYERASSATDVYALGCIAVALLTGKPPFPGPTMDDYREQHLQSVVPHLGGLSARLVSVAGAMLKKEASLRPSLARVTEQLRAPVIALQAGSGAHALAQASAVFSAQKAAVDAQDGATAEALNKRKRIAKAAYDDLVAICRVLFNEIRQHAPEATVEEIPQGIGPHVFRARLGNGALRAIVKQPTIGGILPASKWNVVTEGAILLEATGTYKRSASLWFTDRGYGGEFRWYELAFMKTFAPPPEPNHNPFALDMDDSDADLAIAPIMHTHQLGSPTFAIDAENQSEFIERWLKRFSEAASGTLQRPHGMPVQD